MWQPGKSSVKSRETGENMQRSAATDYQRIEYIVTDLINALPGNSSVNTNTGNNRRETAFSNAVRA
jgi:hypothetical protein